MSEMNIKLNRPNSNSEKYYTTEKNNECVVCGKVADSQKCCTQGI